MEILDNINHLLGDNLKQTITPGSKLKIAALCFSIYAFEALKQELQSIESLQFVFTSPTFVPDEVTDKAHKERGVILPTNFITETYSRRVRVAID